MTNQVRVVAGLPIPSGRSSFRPDEVAALLRVTSQHVVNLMEAGKIGTTTDRRRIPVEELISFLDSRAVRPSLPAPALQPPRSGAANRPQVS